MFGNQIMLPLFQNDLFNAYGKSVEKEGKNLTPF